MSISKTRPFRRDEVEDYERRRYRGLDQKIVHNREQRILDRILSRVAEPADFPVLDAPCGFGRFSKFLLERATFLASSDFSPAMVERTASREGGAFRPRGVVADLKRGLPFASRSFALVFSLRFFHHVHESLDRRAVLSEFGRVSRRWAVVSFYRLNALHRFQRWIRRRAGQGKTRIKMMTRAEFVEEARQAGWRVVRIYPLLRGIHGQHIAWLRKEEKSFDFGTG
ncbi:MAG: class I SAM-dependent methyltransferase [Candidatus Aminicenantes bacterium]|nr:class I SAM-dependent methyltransferase [Candidatus Aminicenantes bacterium]